MMTTAIAAREEGEEEEVKWVKHYSSTHQILLVGDGDFSFSLCLAVSFGSASNICASSLDSYDIVVNKHNKAKSNLETLKKLGACILHGVDATEMKFHPDLKMRKFDRIIFNFPHAGFHGKEDNEHLISKHRTLVEGFFRNASSMLRANGEVHVSHKTTAPFRSWDLEKLACGNSLSLIECVPFKIEDYPGYNNKRGAGKRCDEPFPLGECSTFKFRFSASEKKARVASYKGCTKRRAQQLKERPIQIWMPETSFECLRHPFTNLNMDIKEFPGTMKLPLMMNIQRESHRSFDGCFSNVWEAFPRASSVGDHYTHEFLSFDSVRHRQTNFSRNVNDLPGYVGLPLRSSIQRESVRISDGCFNNVREMLSGAGHNVDYSVHESFISDSERYMAERRINGYLCYLEELHRQSTPRALTSDELRMMLLLYGNPHRY